MRSLRTTVLFEYLIKKRFLARLAYQLFYKRNELTCPAPLFDTFVDEYAAEYGWEHEAVADFVKEIERAGLLEMGDDVMFRHRSFLEYFVALYIFDNRLEVGDVTTLITELYFSDLWSDVAFYFIGLGREMPRNLLDALNSYEAGPHSVAFEKLAIGRLLQAGWYSPTRVKQDGIAAAISHAAEVRDTFQRFAEKAAIPSPQVMSDFVTMTAADVSFDSIMLQKENRAVLENLLAAEDFDPVAIVSLFPSVYRQVPHDERSHFVSRVETALRALGPVEEARAVMALMIATRGDETLVKTLARRVRQLRKRAPKEIRALLPPALKPIRGKRGK